MKIGLLSEREEKDQDWVTGSYRYWTRCGNGRGVGRCEGEAGGGGGAETEGAAPKVLLVKLHVRLPWFGVTIWQRRHWKTVCSISRRSLEKNHHIDHPSHI